MENLFSLIIIIGVVISAISKSNKAAKAQQRRNGNAMPQTARSMPVKPFASAQPAPAPAKPVPAGPSMLTEQPQHELHAPMQPAPLIPTVHVTPHTDDIFTGSMAMESTEGFDPCHEDELPETLHPCEQAPADAAPAMTSGLSLQWTGDAMVKAMVMNEILNKRGRR